MRLQIEIYLKMGTKEYQNEYSKRSCVEEPFVTVKELLYEHERVIEKTKYNQRRKYITTGQVIT